MPGKLSARIASQNKHAVDVLNAMMQARSSTMASVYVRESLSDRPVHSGGVVAVSVR